MSIREGIDGDILVTSDDSEHVGAGLAEALSICRVAYTQCTISGWNQLPLLVGSIVALLDEYNAVGFGRLQALFGFEAFDFTNHVLSIGQAFDVPVLV